MKNICNFWLHYPFKCVEHVMGWFSGTRWISDSRGCWMGSFQFSSFMMHPVRSALRWVQ